jgi:hypothetical protein
MDPMQGEYRKGRIHTMLRERTHPMGDTSSQDGTNNHEINEERAKVFYVRCNSQSHNK